MTTGRASASHITRAAVRSRRRDPPSHIANAIESVFCCVEATPLFVWLNKSPSWPNRCTMMDPHNETAKAMGIDGLVADGA